MPDGSRGAPVRARRVDALDNTDRILAAAKTAFVESPDATMQAIARAAGVGQATMYRNFASREALLVAVYRSDVESLIAYADDVRDRDRPVAALRLWFERLARYGRIKRGASLAVEAATTMALGSEYYPPVIAALGRLLRDAQDAHAVRTDVDADDVLMLLSFLWQTDTGRGWKKRCDAMLSVLLDGLQQVD